MCVFVGVLLTRSIAIVPCVIIAILARNSLDYLDSYINVEQSLLVRYKAFHNILHFTKHKFAVWSF